MNRNEEIVFYQGLEKKFTLFRWFLLTLVTPATFKLSEFKENMDFFIAALILIYVYNASITIAAYSKNGLFHPMLKLTLYFDIAFVSLLLCIRGGLRSDIYFIYFLVILYEGAKFGLRGTINSLVQSLAFFTIASFFFTSPEHFSLGRYIIRAIYLVTLTFIMYEVNCQIDESRAKEKTAQELAYKDPLTKLPNRLLLSENFTRLKLHYEQTERPFAIVLFDIDNFKQINDTKGHTFGDQVLLNLANILRRSISNDDFICRFGGEEFLALYSISDKHSAPLKANKIREQIASHNFFENSITVSIGISMFQQDYTMIENISFADEAMYAAKRSGKNKVIVYQDLTKQTDYFTRSTS